MVIMKRNRTYYEVLQVSKEAAPEMIAAAYRTLMSKLKKHPDLGGDASEAALINEAYETLSDPAKRVRYDSTAGQTPSESGGVKAESDDLVERRRVPRTSSNASVSYCVGHDTKWYPARVKDMSTLGVRIQSHQPIRNGDHIVIAPPNLASTAFHGTVRWTRMFHPSIFERVYEVGIEFSDQITDIEQRLSI